MATKKKSSGRKKSSSGRRKVGHGASKKVAETMRERKRGTLRSGSGKKVTSKKQAIAIGLSEARKAGKSVPKKKSGARKKTSGGSKKKSASGKKKSASS